MHTPPISAVRSEDGNLMHHMMDHRTSLWMQKEVMVPGGAAREHIM